MKWLFAVLVLPLWARAQNSDDQLVRKNLQESEDAWNTGNIDRFMEGYWRSDSLMFIGKEKVVYGYDSTLARYHRTYPSPDAMGKLHFDILRVDRLSDQYFWVLGKWTLTRKKDHPGGHFTLLFRKIDGVWKIIADHTS